MARTGLQFILSILGLVAVAFGILTVFTGGAGVLGGGEVSTNIDTELRFYAAWYVGAGLLLISTVRRIESRATTIRAISAVLVLGAFGRLLSLLTIGAPRPLFTALMAIEFAVPILVVPWQAAIARRPAGQAKQ